jgi:hypothetical protein
LIQGEYQIWSDDKIIMVLIVISVVVVIIGSSFLENDFENSILSFKTPENWIVVDVTTSNSIATIKPLNSNITLISITSIDSSPQEMVNGYISDYSTKYQGFQVITNETVNVDGADGTKLVFKTTPKNDSILTGQEYISSVVAFSKNNQTYLITSNEVSSSDYSTLVGPAMNTIIKSLRIKGY